MPKITASAAGGGQIQGRQRHRQLEQRIVVQAQRAQHLQRARLVQRLVEVAALRALHARRAAARARAAAEQAGSVGDPAGEALEAALDQTLCCSNGHYNPLMKCDCYQKAHDSITPKV